MYMLPVCRRSLSELKISVRTMLKDAATLSCPGRALLNRFCHAGTVVGWLMLMVQSPVQAQAGAERRYRLLSCPRAAVAAAAEQLWGSPCSGAASAASSRRSSQATYCSSSSRNSSSSNSSIRAVAAAGLGIHSFAHHLLAHSLRSLRSNQRL